MSNMNQTVQPVILAGGGGTRLWPLSRENYPKQFLSLDGGLSLLQSTLLRLNGSFRHASINPPLVICNEAHRFLVQDHKNDIGIPPGGILLEPVGRNTAPALTCAAVYFQEADPILLMLPADHVIDDIDGFNKAVSLGVELASQGMLITFGIVPHRAETGYGYIRGGASLSNGAYRLQEFVEKPALESAENYVRSGEYFWNSGIFMMRASVWERAIKKFQPDIYAACEKAVTGGSRDGDFLRLHRESFVACPSDSVDYAVMEKICSPDNEFQPVLIALDAGWSDVGSWSAVWEVTEKTVGGNVFRGDVIAEDTESTIVYSEHRLVATVGVSNLLVVETADAVLVGDMTRSQDVKKLVTRLKTDAREELLNHRQVYRPWGSYISIDNGPNFQVKRLIVKPGKKLSLQLHHRRAEHWVVVKGTATVTIGTETFELEKNQSTYIPVETRHRLENKGTEMLEIIEVQSGDYLGEDDIVRFEDDFGRHK
ncbi:MAG: cpsB [Gammaproteobacteria bacterium]|nr:cpsB [Gammaproteobacteria bacterium]